MHRPGSDGVDSGEVAAVSRFGPAAWLTPLALAGALLLAESFNHTLFHTLAEFFAVSVAVLTAVVGWQTYPFSRNNFLVYLACGYFWIGTLDLAHALAYEGMGIFAGPTADISIKIWLGTRYLEAMLLLGAPLALGRAVERNTTFWGFGSAAGLLLVSVAGGWFPTAFVPGQGLTSFKVTSEYIIIAILAAAFVHLWWRRDSLDRRLVWLTGGSLVLTAAAEFSLTVYSAVGDAPTVVGHLLKLFSYWLIYLGVIGTTLTEPFRILARDASSFDAVPDPTVVVDEHRLVRQANRAARSFLKMSAAECVGRHCHELFHADDVTPDACPVCAAITAGRALDGCEVELGRLHRWHQISLSPVGVGSGHAGTVHVSRDVTERKSAEQALLRLNAELEERIEARTEALSQANRELEAFSYSVSHDLRAPLRGIDGFSRVLIDRYADQLDERARDYLARVRRASQRMGELIDDLLSLSRINRQDLRSDPAVDLTALARDVVDELREREPNRQVTVELQPGLLADCDRRMLRVVLENLLGNAWKYTGRCEQASIAFGRSEQGEFFVRDNGAGFDMRYADKLFAPFQRLHRADEFEGNGIGLATVHRVIQRHGGSIRADSLPGCGTTFFFTLDEQAAAA